MTAALVVSTLFLAAAVVVLIVWTISLHRRLESVERMAHTHHFVGDDWPHVPTGNTSPSGTPAPPRSARAHVNQEH